MERDCNNYYAINTRSIYAMNIKKTVALVLGGVLLVGCLAGCSASASAIPDSYTPQNISYQPQTVVAVGNTVNSSSTASETPGGSVDYSTYEPYGLLYDKENHYYTYNGNVVRFFNDPVIGASFTNFFSGTVDIEAEYDGNKLIGIKECSKEVYDWHTQKHNGISSLAGETATQVGGVSSQSWLKDYADSGITYDTESGGWCYNGQRIKILLDGEQTRIYLNEEGGICISVIRDNNKISEIKEISEQDAQSFMQNNSPTGEDYATQD